MNGDIFDFLPKTLQTPIVIGALFFLYKIYTFINNKILISKQKKNDFKNQILEEEKSKGVFDKRLTELEIKQERMNEDIKEHKTSTSEWLMNIDSKVNRILEYMIKSK